MQVWPAAEGYEFHLRDASNTAPQHYYGKVYQGGSEYTGAAGGPVNVSFTKTLVGTAYEYISVPIIAERFPVGSYAMKIYSDEEKTDELGNIDFTIIPMVHITNPGLHSTSDSVNISITGYISNWAAITLIGLNLDLNGSVQDIRGTAYLNAATGEFSVPITLNSGNNRFEIISQYSSTQTSSTGHSIWGETSYTDGDNCFIATAAYGSKFQPCVALLREFRDTFLLTNHPGRAFVAFYYKHSPPIASYIAGNEGLKAIVRALLTPTVGVAYLMLHPRLISALFIALVMAMLLRRQTRRKRYFLD